MKLTTDNRPLTTWVLSLLLVVVTIALYYPVNDHPFSNYDDNGYVTANARVQSGLNRHTIKWAFLTFDQANWHPVTWMSHALDCQLFQLDPAGHHDVNLLLHVVNVLLLFWVLYRATGFAGRSFMVAALFALHPINVQTVAWIAERKNVLSMLFFLLALGAYQWYVRAPRATRYAVVALLFALGLMAKPQVITLPLVLLLWDYWPLRRISARAVESPSGKVPATISAKSIYVLVEEKFPLFAIAGLSAVITMRAQGSNHATNWLPLSVRLSNAIVSYARYVGKAFWPSRLALYYPHPGDSLKAWVVMASLTFLLAVTAFVVLQRRHRYLPVGWFWFLGTLVPMIGVVQVGGQAMADRYAYLPFIGLFMMICWGVAEWAEERSVSVAWLAAVGVAVLVALSAVSYRQIGYWGDNIVLWQHTIDVTAPNFIAEDILGGALVDAGRGEEALQHYHTAVEIAPNDPISNLDLAMYAQRHGDPQQAIARAEVVLRSVPAARLRMKAYRTMGLAYRDLGNETKAQECLEAAQEQRP